MSDRKDCRVCGVNKPLSDYYEHKYMADGHLNECKKCKKKASSNNKRNFSTSKDSYDKSVKGVIRVMYKTQKRHNKLRGHGDMVYTKEEFKEWLYENNFMRIYEVWRCFDFKKDLKPSVDRINNSKGYSFDKMKLVTWKTNRLNQYDDNRKKSKKIVGLSVSQFTKNGVFVANFESQTEAFRETGVNNKNISACLGGKRKSSGGFVWKRGKYRNRTILKNN